MTDERPTVRPVTLARLVETAHLCTPAARSTEAIETDLEITHRRARETILEACRIGLLTEIDGGDSPRYRTSASGTAFLEAVTQEDWSAVSEVLRANSPHYSRFLEIVDAHGPAGPDTILAELEATAPSGYTYNRTTIDVVSDWGERLGVVQRNAFSGHLYPVERSDVPPRFPETLITVFDDLESTAGVTLRQRYLPIPELREHTCERVGLRRAAFDRALGTLADQNVGRLELSGAPIDTGAKDAVLGIKTIELTDGDGLVSTSQSSDLVMAGIEQHGKQYYYLAIHDRDLTFTPTDD